MACYRLIWKASAEKELRKLPHAVICRLVELAESLADNPFPAGCRKLTGAQHSYRIRSGDYRLVYEIHGGKLIVQSVRIAHRSEVYR